MTTYVVTQGKGGATKTTTACELAAALDGPTLVIDGDQQGDAAARLGAVATPRWGTAELLLGDATPEDAAVPSSVAGVDVIVGTDALAELDRMPECVGVLADVLPDVVGEGKRWRHCVIDTPAGLGVLTQGALAAADVVIAPVMCTGEGVRQLGRLATFIERRVARRLRPGQVIHWVIPTRYDGRRNLDREVVEQLEETYPGRVTHPVRAGVVAGDSFVAGLPVGVYDPRSGVARDYARAFETITATTKEAER